MDFRVSGVDKNEEKEGSGLEKALNRGPLSAGRLRRVAGRYRLSLSVGVASFLDPLAFIGTGLAGPQASSCQLRSGVSPVLRARNLGHPRCGFWGSRPRPPRQIRTPRLRCSGLQHKARRQGEHCVTQQRSRRRERAWIHRGADPRAAGTPTLSADPPLAGMDALGASIASAQVCSSGMKL